MFVHVTNSTKVKNTATQPKRKHFTSRSAEKLKHFTIPSYKKSMNKSPTISSFIREKRQKSCLQVNKTSDITVFITENGDQNDENNKEIIDTLLENIISNDTLNLSNWDASAKGIQLWEVLQDFDKKEYSIQILDVSQSGITQLPSEIMHIKNLKTLIVNNNNLLCIPKELGIYQHLKYINLNYNNLSELSLYAQSLEVLKVNYNNISNICDILFTCQKLQILEISHNKLTAVPENIKYLENLRIIDISHNSLHVLPVQFSKLKNLLRMNFNNNELVEMPPLNDIRVLEYLNINNNKIKLLPEICSYGCMKEIHANTNNIDKLDYTMLCKLTSLEVLEVSANSIVHIPIEMKNIKTLKHLNVSHNNIIELPEELKLLPHLCILFGNQNVKYEIDLNENYKNVSSLKNKDESIKSGDMPVSETECEDEIFKCSWKGYTNITCPRKTAHYQPAINYFMRSKVFDSSCEDIHIADSPLTKRSNPASKAQDQKLKNSCPNCTPRFDETHFGYVYQPIPMFYYPSFAIPNMEQDCVKHLSRYRQTKRSKKSYAEHKVYYKENKQKKLNKDAFVEIYSKRAKEGQLPSEKNNILERKRVECFKPANVHDEEKEGILSNKGSQVSTAEVNLKNNLFDVPQKLPVTAKECIANILNTESIANNENALVAIQSTTNMQCEVTYSKSLHILDFSNTKLDFVSDDIFKEAARLNKQNVNLENNCLTACPIGIILMKEKLKELNLSCNNLHHVQQYLGELINIEVLNLSYNKVSNLPQTLKQCKKLKELSLSHNMLCFVPSVIYEIESLRTLNLSNNMIDEIERYGIIKLKYLETLDLSHNHITMLPPEICKLSNLINIHLVGNNIRHFTESDLLKNGKEILHLISVKMRNM